MGFSGGPPWGEGWPGFCGNSKISYLIIEIQLQNQWSKNYTPKSMIQKLIWSSIILVRMGVKLGSAANQWGRGLVSLECWDHNGALKWALRGCRPPLYVCSIRRVCSLREPFWCQLLISWGSCKFGFIMHIVYWVLTAGSTSMYDNQERQGLHKIQLELGL